MKTSRYNFKYRSTASKLHRKVGDVLRNSSLFSGHKIFQEYPVNKIMPEYPNASHKFDWVILDLYLVIECHGAQHYKIVDFGKNSTESVDQFHNQRYRDNKKMQAAIDAGFTYIEIPYNDEAIVDEQYLWDKYKELYNPIELPVKEEEEDLYKEEQLARARTWRREQYEMAKKYKRQLKLRSVPHEED